MEAMMEGDHKAINQLKRSSPGELAEEEVAELGNGQTIPQPPSEEEEESDEEKSEETPASSLGAAEPAVLNEPTFGELPAEKTGEVAGAPPVGGTLEAVPAETPGGEPSGAVPAEAPVGTVPAEAPLGEVPAEAPLGEVPAEAPLGEVPAEAPIGAVPAEAPLGTVPAEAPLGEPLGAVPAEAPGVEPLGEVPPAASAGEPLGVAPAEAPVEEPLGAAPAEAPLGEPLGEVPPEAPVEGPSEVVPATPLGDVPAEAPAGEPLGEVPADVPVEEPLGAVPATPVGEVPAEVPVEEPLGAVPATPAGEAPAAAPVGEPLGAVPSEAPGGEPATTPLEETPGETPPGLASAEPTGTVPVAPETAPEVVPELPAQPELPPEPLPPAEVQETPFGAPEPAGEYLPPSGLPESTPELTPVEEQPIEVPSSGVSGSPEETGPVLPSEQGSPEPPPSIEGTPIEQPSSELGEAPVEPGPGEITSAGSPAGSLVPPNAEPEPSPEAPLADADAGAEPNLRGEPEQPLAVPPSETGGIPVAVEPESPPTSEVPTSAVPGPLEPELNSPSEVPANEGPAESTFTPESEVSPSNPSEVLIEEPVEPVEEVPMQYESPDYPTGPQDQENYVNQEPAPAIDGTQPVPADEYPLESPQKETLAAQAVPTEGFPEQPAALDPRFTDSEPEQPVEMAQNPTAFSAQDYPIEDISPSSNIPADEAQFAPVENLGGNAEYPLEPTQEIGAYPGEETPFQPSGLESSLLTGELYGPTETAEEPLQSPPLTSADFVYPADTVGDYPVEAPEQLPPVTPVENPIGVVEKSAVPQPVGFILAEPVSPYGELPYNPEILFQPSGIDDLALNQNVLVEPVLPDPGVLSVVELASPLEIPSNQLEEGSPPIFDQGLSNTGDLQPPVGNENYLPPGLVPDISSFPEGPLPVDDSQELLVSPPLPDDVSLEEPEQEIGTAEILPAYEGAELNKPGEISPETEKLGGGFAGSLNEGDEHLTAGQRRSAAFGTPVVLQNQVPPPVKEVPLSIFPSRMLSKLNGQEGMPVLVPHAGLQNEIPTKRPTSVFIPEGTIATPALILETLPKTLQEAVHNSIPSTADSQIPVQANPAAAQGLPVETIQQPSPLQAVGPSLMNAPADNRIQFLPGLRQPWPHHLRNPFRPLQGIIPQQVPHQAEMSPQSSQPASVPQTEPCASPNAVPHQPQQSASPSPLSHLSYLLPQNSQPWLRNLFSPRQPPNIAPNSHLTRQFLPDSRQATPTKAHLLQESPLESQPSLAASKPHTKEPLSPASPRQLASPKSPIKPAVQRPPSLSTRRELAKLLREPSSPTAREELASERPQNTAVNNGPSPASPRKLASPNQNGKSSLLRPFSSAFRREPALPNLRQNRLLFPTYPYRPIQIEPIRSQPGTVNPKNFVNRSEPITQHLSSPKSKTSVEKVPKKLSTLTNQLSDFKNGLSAKSAKQIPSKPPSSAIAIPESPKVAHPESPKFPIKNVLGKIAQPVVTPEKNPEPAKIPLSHKVEQPVSKPNPQPVPAPVPLPKPLPTDKLILNPRLREQNPKNTKAAAVSQDLTPPKSTEPQPAPATQNPLRKLIPSQHAQNHFISQLPGTSSFGKTLFPQDQPQKNAGTSYVPLRKLVRPSFLQTASSENVPIQQVPPPQESQQTRILSSVEKLPPHPKPTEKPLSPKSPDALANKAASLPQTSPIEKNPHPKPSSAVFSKVVNLSQPKTIDKPLPPQSSPSPKPHSNNAISVPRIRPIESNPTSVKSPTVLDSYVPLRYLVQPFNVPYSPNYQVNRLAFEEPELPLPLSAPSQYIPLFLSRQRSPAKIVEKAAPVKVTSPAQPKQALQLSSENSKSESKSSRPVNAAQNMVLLSNEHLKPKVTEKLHVPTHQLTEVSKASPIAVQPVEVVKPNAKNHVPDHRAISPSVAVASPPANLVQRPAEAVPVIRAVSVPEYAKAPYSWTDIPNRYLASNVPYPVVFQDRHFGSPVQVSPTQTSQPYLANFLQKIPVTWVRPVLTVANQNQWPRAH